MHSFSRQAFARDTLRRRPQTVSVIVPTLNEAASIKRTLRPLRGLLDEELVDQVAVVDSGSTDGTLELAAAMGVECYDARALHASVGPLLGKGDAMWRALGITRGEVACYVDADSEDFGEHFIFGLVGPLLREPALHFVKGTYRRPFKLADQTVDPNGGGRVTELTARPLLNAFYPELAAFGQPLAGEIAARSELLRSLPFDTGYAVETGMLIDVFEAVGIDAMAEVDLGTRQNRHRPLTDLVPMAGTVLQAVVSRLREQSRLAGAVSTEIAFSTPEGRRHADLAIVQRPPLNSVASAPFAASTPT